MPRPMSSTATCTRPPAGRSRSSSTSAPGTTYVANDFVDGGGTVVRDNAPSYVAALCPPFTAELAVIAGRSVIEIAANGHMTGHD